MPSIADLRDLIAQFEMETAAVGFAGVDERFKLLDHLEVLLAGCADAKTETPAAGAEALQSLLALRARLEAVNEELYQSIRTEIQQGSRPSLFAQWLQSSEVPVAGLGYDATDEIVSGVLALVEPDQLPHPPDGMVFYQPTPARHIFHLLRMLGLTGDDVLIDLGSGLGHVPLLATICTGARSFGIEREAAYVASARQSAEQFKLNRTVFVHQDAREADLSSGTVFFLYTPFTGHILMDVLQSLRRESTHRPIRVGTFGPCAAIVGQEKWLMSDTTPECGQITVFSSRSPGSF